MLHQKLPPVSHQQKCVRAVFHKAEFSSQNNIFFRLLTPTLRQLVFKQKKMSLRAENSAQWKIAFINGICGTFEIKSNPFGPVIPNKLKRFERLDMRVIKCKKMRFYKYIKKYIAIPNLEVAVSLKFKVDAISR